MPLCAESPQQLGPLDDSVPGQVRTRVKVRRDSTPLTHPDWTPGQKVQRNDGSGCFAATTVAAPTLSSWSSSCGLQAARPLTRPRSVPVASARDAQQGVRSRPRGDVRAPGSSSRRHLQAPATTREAPPLAKRGGSLEWRRGSESRAPSPCDSARGPSPGTRTSDYGREPQQEGDRTHS
ncbi:hypothetical protein STEG23_025351 [Scotinomys teguina]